MNNRFVILMLIALLLCQCISEKEILNKKKCSTKYPLVLVHGIGFRDDVPFIHYWSRLPKVLDKNGAKVYLARQDAINTHVENALKLRERVLTILDETGSEKVNLIAHSKGGLESRYMISKLNMADKVASLTTLASPHRGSFLADTVLSWLNKKEWLKNVVSAANNYAHFLGDEKPNALKAAQNLTVDYMKHFNQSVPNAPGVYYQSYGGVVTENYPSLKIRFQHKIMQEKEGDNDCTVSKESYQWGKFKGVVKSEQDFGVSHFDIVGMKFVSKQSTFDAEKFMVEIVKDLKERGF